VTFTLLQCLILKLMYTFLCIINMYNGRINKKCICVFLILYSLFFNIGFACKAIIVQVMNDTKLFSMGLWEHP